MKIFTFHCGQPEEHMRRIPPGVFIQLGEEVIAEFGTLDSVIFVCPYCMADVITELSIPLYN